MKNLYTIIALMLVTTVGYGQKFGYINSSALLSEMPEVKVADSELKGLETQLRKKAENEIKMLQSKYQDLQRKEQSGEMSPKQIQEEATKLKAEEGNLAKLDEDLRIQLQTKQQELYKPIIDRVNKAIEDVAKENGFQFIFDTTAGLLYADETLDVSTMVRSKLGL